MWRNSVRCQASPALTIGNRPRLAALPKWRLRRYDDVLGSRDSPSGNESPVSSPARCVLETPQSHAGLGRVTWVLLRGRGQAPVAR